MCLKKLLGRGRVSVSFNLEITEETRNWVLALATKSGLIEIGFWFGTK